MKRLKKIYIWITSILLIAGCVATIGYLGSAKSLSTEKVEILRHIILLDILLIMIAIIIFCALIVIAAMKQGIHNINVCDDELFKKIDNYKKHWGEDKYYYIRQIQIINLYYKENGKVDELVNNREIEKLYTRADYLLIQKTLFDNLLTCFYSLAISVIASFVCKMMECENVLFMLVWVLTILISFFGIVLSRYVQRGQAGSYRYLVDEYERKLLMQKIMELEKSLIVTDEDEKIIETKQSVIKELIRIRGRKVKKKQKDEVEEAIKRIGELELCVGDYSNYCLHKININGMDGYLVYNKENEKEKNHISKSNLINHKYVQLYEIMEKYDLISNDRRKEY